MTRGVYDDDLYDGGPDGVPLDGVGALHTLRGLDTDGVGLFSHHDPLLRSRQVLGSSTFLFLFLGTFVRAILRVSKRENPGSNDY